MKVETIVVGSLLGACEQLSNIPAGPDTLVLLTGRLYEEIAKVGSEVDESYRYGDKASANLVKSFRLYSIHSIRTVQVKLIQDTAWVALVEFDYKEFSAKVEKNLYVVDLEQ